MAIRSLIRGKSLLSCGSFWTKGAHVYVCMLILFKWQNLMSVARIVVIVQLCGCGRGNNPTTPEIQFVSLQKVFGVQWPTNIIREHVSSWNYTAILDGSSQNSETIAKFSIPSSSFAAWQSSLTNVMEIYPHFGVPDEPALSSKYSWWDVHRFPSSQVAYYFEEIGKRPAYFAQLEMYAVESNGIHTVYVHGQIVK